MAQVAIPPNQHQHHYHQPSNQAHFAPSATVNSTVTSDNSSPQNARLPPLATTTNANSTTTTTTIANTNPPSSSTITSSIPYLLSPQSSQILYQSQPAMPLQLPPLNLPTTSLYQLQLQQLHQQHQHHQQQQQQQQEKQQYSYTAQQNQPHIYNYQPFITPVSNYARSASDLSLYSNITNSNSSHSSQNSLPSLNMVLNKINSNSSVILPSLSSYPNLQSNSDYKSESLLSNSPSSVNSNTSLSITNIDNSNSNRKYKCIKCNKGFTTSGHLARHNRIHTGVKNHICPFEGCNSRFSRQDNCMQHYKTHLKAKKSRKKSSKIPGKD